MNNTRWIAYHCKISSLTYQQHYVALAHQQHFVAFIDSDSLKVVGCCSTNIPNFTVIIDLLKGCLIKHSKPSTIYVTKDWIKELSPYLPKLYFKDVKSFPREEKKHIDNFFTNLIMEDYPDMSVRTNYE